MTSEQRTLPIDDVYRAAIGILIVLALACFVCSVFISMKLLAAESGIAGSIGWLVFAPGPAVAGFVSVRCAWVLRRLLVARKQAGVT